MSTCTQQPETAEFIQQWHIYLDSVKPDRLARDQAQLIQLEWTPLNPNQERQEKKDVNLSNDEVTSKNKGQILSGGRLKLVGSLMSVELDATCRYTRSETRHSLHFVVTIAKVSFRTKSEIRRQQKKLQSNNNKTNNEEQQSKQTNEDHNETLDSLASTMVNDKIRTGLIKRLRQDPFVSRLLQQQQSNDEKTTTTILCEAQIDMQQHQQQQKQQRHSNGNDHDNGSNNHVPHDNTKEANPEIIVSHAKHMEDRFQVAQDPLEGLRRAIFSKWDSGLEVLDLLLALPLLPNATYTTKPTASFHGSHSGSAHDDDNDGKRGVEVYQIMAQRARLRLLEDAMVDACDEHDSENENEPAKELADGLHISENMPSRQRERRKRMKKT